MGQNKHVFFGIQKIKKTTIVHQMQKHDILVQYSEAESCVMQWSGIHLPSSPCKELLSVGGENFDIF